MWVGARPNDYPVVTVMAGLISVEELPDVEVELERNQFRTPTCAPREAVGGLTPAICETPGAWRPPSKNGWRSSARSRSTSVFDQRSRLFSGQGIVPGIVTARSLERVRSDGMRVLNVVSGQVTWNGPLDLPYETSGTS